MSTYVELPRPVPLSPIEQAFVEEEPAGLFPPNQDSNAGLHRKVFCDQLTNVADQIQLIYNEKWPLTSSEFLQYHEFEMGIPMNPPYTLLQRQNLVMIQWLRGPFTVGLIKTVVAFFINAVLTPNPAPTFGASGIPIGSGIPLYSGEGGSPYGYFWISFSPETFTYVVIIDAILAVDMVGLTRELNRITPAGMSFIVETTEDIFADPPQPKTYIPYKWLHHGPFSAG